MKSIDIYLFVCFFMVASAPAAPLPGVLQVFGALIEYACVGYTDKRIQLRKNRYLAMQKIMDNKRNEVSQKAGIT